MRNPNRQVMTTLAARPGSNRAHQFMARHLHTQAGMALAYGENIFADLLTGRLLWAQPCSTVQSRTGVKEKEVSHMNTTRTITQAVDLSDDALVSMIRATLAANTEDRKAQGTYLRTLAAAVQVELGGVPARGRIKAVSVEEAVAALNACNQRFYALVLAALDANGTIDALERNSRSGFARSAASTLRAAFRAGLSPLQLPLQAATISLTPWPSR